MLCLKACFRLGAAAGVINTIRESVISPLVIVPVPSISVKMPNKAFPSLDPLLDFIFFLIQLHLALFVWIDGYVMDDR